VNDLSRGCTVADIVNTVACERRSSSAQFYGAVELLLLLLLLLGGGSTKLLATTPKSAARQPLSCAAPQLAFDLLICPTLLLALQALPSRPSAPSSNRPPSPAPLLRRERPAAGPALARPTAKECTLLKMQATRAHCPLHPHWPAEPHSRPHMTHTLLPQSSRFCVAADAELPAGALLLDTQTAGGAGGLSPPTARSILPCSAPRCCNAPARRLGPLPAFSSRCPYTFYTLEMLP